MIPAKRVGWFNAWFSGVARSKIHASFQEVRAYGLDEARALAAEAPLLILSNHTSWWDPLVAIHLSTHLLNTEGHAMMDAKNLRRLPFFALVGAFGVDLDKPSDGAAAMRYAARVLDAPRKMVWVYPQGRERPVTERPLGFRPGSAEIARVAKKARVLPVALRYEHGGSEKPSLWLSFGPPIAAERDTNKGRERQEEAVTAELERIERAIVAENNGEEERAFAVLHRQAPSRFGLFMERMLAAMTRPWVMRGLPDQR